jgi:hypothetical protein
MDDTDPTDAPVRRPRLPDAALPPVAGGEAVPLRLPRTGTVLALLDGAPDAAARAWLAALADAGATLRASDGRALVLIPEAAAARDLPGGVAVLVDERGRVAAAAGVGGPRAGDHRPVGRGLARAGRAARRRLARRGGGRPLARLPRDPLRRLRVGQGRARRAAGSSFAP